MKNDFKNYIVSFPGINNSYLQKAIVEYYMGKLPAGQYYHCNITNEIGIPNKLGVNRIGKNVQYWDGSKTIKCNFDLKQDICSVEMLYDVKPTSCDNLFVVQVTNSDYYRKIFLNHFLKRRIGTSFYTPKQFEPVTDDKFKEFFINHFGARLYTPYSKVYSEYVMNNKTYNVETFVKHVQERFEYYYNQYFLNIVKNNASYYSDIEKKIQYTNKIYVDYEDYFIEGNLQGNILDDLVDGVMANEKTSDDIGQNILNTFKIVL